MGHLTLTQHYFLFFKYEMSKWWASPHIIRCRELGHLKGDNTQKAKFFFGWGTKFKVPPPAARKIADYNFATTLCLIEQALKGSR